LAEIKAVLAGRKGQSLRDIAEAIHPRAVHLKQSDSVDSNVKMAEK